MVLLPAVALGCQDGETAGEAGGRPPEANNVETVEAEKAQATERPADQPLAPVAVAASAERGDQLHDFVVDAGDWYRHPESWDELKTAAERGLALRNSAFFLRRYGRGEPFLGKLPASLCLTTIPSSNRRIDRLEIWKDSTWVGARLPTPESPRVTIVSAWSASNAQVALYEQRAPVSYRRAPYWAAVYAGSASSTPRVFVVDRVTLSKRSASILLHKPPRMMATTDLVPYWFLIPLGNLRGGDYTVDVRLTDKDKPLATTTVGLREATADEEAQRNEEMERRMVAAKRRSTIQRKQAWEQGAELQLRLERLAEFVQAADLSESTRGLLAGDVAALGESAVWDKPTPPTRYSGRPLQSATPGESPNLRPPRQPLFAKQRGPWKPSEIALRDIWLCDGTDAGWFASQRYRSVPGFQHALKTKSPTETQRKIRDIWQTIEESATAPSRQKLRTLVAAGTIEDALDAAHQVIVKGEEPPRLIAANTPIWAVLVAETSFLVRGVDTSYHHDQRRGVKRIEFRINLSGYLAGADNVTSGQRAPVTFGLAPLGRLPADHSVGVTFACPSLCCRAVGPEGAELLDIKPNDLMASKYRGYLSYPTGFQTTPE